MFMKRATEVGEVPVETVKANPQRASAATLALPLPLEYIVTLENGGGGIDFQASQCIPMGFKLTLDAAADAWRSVCLYPYAIRVSRPWRQGWSKTQTGDVSIISY